jgi:hypothetical protein
MSNQQSSRLHFPRDAINPKPWDLLSHGLDLNLDLDLVWTLVWICYQRFGFGFGFGVKDLDLVWIWLCWNHKFTRRKTDLFIYYQIQIYS